MRKEVFLNYMKLSVLSDLLIQYADEIDKKSVLGKELESTIKLLEPVANSMYEINYMRRNATIQEIQNKIDTIFRHTFRDIKIN